MIESELRRAARDLLGAKMAFNEWNDKIGLVNGAWERATEAAERLQAAWEPLRAALSTPEQITPDADAVVEEYAQEYEFNDGESFHRPNELEGMLLVDFGHGLVSLLHERGLLAPRLASTSEPTDNQISCKGILDNSTPEPSREPTQEQVEAWALDADMPQTRVAWKTVHERDFFYEALQRFATLAHAAGFDAGMRAGGKDAERWTYFLSRVRGERSVDGRGQFIQPKIKPVGGIMSGSIAEHFKNAIDAAIAKDTKHG